MQLAMLQHRKVDVREGEQTFSLKGEERVTNTNGLAIVGDARVSAELREGTGRSW